MAQGTIHPSCVEHQRKRNPVDILEIALNDIRIGHASRCIVRWNERRALYILMDRRWFHLLSWYFPRPRANFKRPTVVQKQRFGKVHGKDRVVRPLRSMTFVLWHFEGSRPGRFRHHLLLFLGCRDSWLFMLSWCFGLIWVTDAICD